MLMQEINRKRWSRSSGREKQKEDLNGRARPPDYREYQLSQKEWMQYLIMGAGAAGLCAYTFYLQCTCIFISSSSGFSVSGL